ncbi:MAG: hypothetical protein ACYTGB_10005, partial [Planctomycetota bacterium]
MSHQITREELLEWCSVPAGDLEGHPKRRVPFRMAADRAEMGEVMARELVDTVRAGNAEGRATRAILPCGPTCWYEPFRRIVNEERVSLASLVVFHMDECLDWQGRLLPRGHPYNFRAFMEKHFYAPVDAELRTPEGNRVWLTPARIGEIGDRI